MSFGIMPLPRLSWWTPDKAYEANPPEGEHEAQWKRNVEGCFDCCLTAPILDHKPPAWMTPIGGLSSVLGSTLTLPLWIDRRRKKREEAAKKKAEG